MVCLYILISGIKLKKKIFAFFFHFSKIHRGDPYDYDQNRKGPSYEFWKIEKKMQKFFFFNLIPDIKMYAQTINKNDVRNFPTQLAWPQ